MDQRIHPGSMGLAAGTMVGAGGGRNDVTGARVTTLVSPHEKVKGR
jgi:hypothetical protein